MTQTVNELELGLIYDDSEGLPLIKAISAETAAATAEREHYMHRRPLVSFAYGLLRPGELLGVCVFGTPASRHLQKGVCPTAPDKVIELNRLWVDDCLPANTESWFVTRCLKLLPPLIVVSYADTTYGHVGYIYRALNFRYAGWTDMERRTPRREYLPAGGAHLHSRDAFRNGHKGYVRRHTKVRYWTTTGNRRQRAALAAICAWPVMNWKTEPPPLNGHRQRRVL
jgi:hypothetical protein